MSAGCGGFDEALKGGVARRDFLEDFSAENLRVRSKDHDDTRSRPLTARSSVDLTWEALTAVDPGGTGEAQAQEIRSVGDVEWLNQTVKQRSGSSGYESRCRTNRRYGAWQLRSEKAKQSDRWLAPSIGLGLAPRV